MCSFYSVLKALGTLANIFCGSTQLYEWMGIAFEWLDDYVEQKIVTSLLA